VTLSTFFCVRHQREFAAEEIGECPDGPGCQILIEVGAQWPKAKASIGVSPWNHDEEPDE
jgi:hypothetical protein